MAEDELFGDTFWKSVVEDFKKEKFDETDLEVLLKIYQWTKAEKNKYFFDTTLKRIEGYTNSLKKLKKKQLIYLVKSTGPYRITEDLIRLVNIIIELQEKGYL